MRAEVIREAAEQQESRLGTETSLAGLCTKGCTSPSLCDVQQNCCRWALLHADWIEIGGVDGGQGYRGEIGWQVKVNNQMTKTDFYTLLRFTSLGLAAYRLIIAILLLILFRQTRKILRCRRNK